MAWSLTVFHPRSGRSSLWATRFRTCSPQQLRARQQACLGRLVQSCSSDDGSTRRRDQTRSCQPTGWRAQEPLWPTRLEEPAVVVLRPAQLVLSIRSGNLAG